MRIAVATALATVPMALVLVLADAYARQRAAEQELRDFAIEALERSRFRDRCESGEAIPFPGPPAGPPPPGFPAHPLPGDARPSMVNPPLPPREPPLVTPLLRMHRKPARLFGYDRDGVPHQPDAPALKREELGGIVGDAMVSRSTLWNAGDVEILVAVPEPKAKCHYVVAQGTKEPWLGAILPPTRVWLLPIAGVLLATVVAVGPVVRRLRRLTELVEQQAGSGYQAEVGAIAAGGDEVDDLARAFDAAGREVRALLAAKDRREQALRDYVADTTHDVMIPLTVLQGHLTTMRDETNQGAVLEPGTLSEAMQEAHYIASLLHNLGVATKLDAERPQLQLTSVDLGALVDRVVARHRSIGERLGVSIEGASPEARLYAYADLTLLEQAMSNLVYNAVRYNHRGGHVAVFVDDVATERFSLNVIDDGPGIAPDVMERVRERGVRGDDARTRAPSGHGLGINIAVRVCELHGYSFEMRQASDEGGLHVEVRGPARDGSR